MTHKPDTTGLRNPGLLGQLQRFVESTRTQQVITGLIILNAVTLGLETSERATAAAGDLLRMLDRAILAIFTLEVAAKILVYRHRFPRDPWNVFDFLVVGVGLVPATEGFSVLRALRVLRVLRLISMVPSMRNVVGALLHAIPGISSVVLLLSLVYYVAAVMATNLFSASFPEWFGTIGSSMYTLFQIMTLESWSMGIVRPVMEVYPHAWAFFVPFILIASFTVLNLFIAIIVDVMQSQHQNELDAQEAEKAKVARDERARISHEVAALKDEVRALREALQDSGRTKG